MSTTRRKFTVEEKTNVLQQAQREGIAPILREYNLSYSVFARWRKKYPLTGTIARTTPPDTIRLMQENTRLKKIVADLALALELKDEELRRSGSFHNQNLR